MHQQIFYFIFLCYFCDFVTIERLIFYSRSFINPHLSVQRLDDRSANEHFGTLFRRSLILNLQQIFCPFLLANSWLLHICPTVSNTAPDFLDFCHVVIVCTASPQLLIETYYCIVYSQRAGGKIVKLNSFTQDTAELRARNCMKIKQT